MGAAMLVDVYRELRHSIVGFVPRFARSEQEAKQFPPIFGTGFVVHEDGIIVTNDHVMDAFGTLPRPPGSTDFPAMALLFVLTSKGNIEVPLDVVGVGKLSEFKPGPAYFGPDMPDIAYIQVAARGLKAVRLADSSRPIEEGEELATSGFPMGTDILEAPGWMHQMTPTLQRGVVSAVHPFPCPTPHGFTMNINVQGGASGSPVFRTDSGEVVGVIYAGMHEVDVGGKGSALMTRLKLPTNYAFAVPAHYIVKSLPDFIASGPATNAAQYPTIKELMKQKSGQNTVTGETVDLDGLLPW